MGVWMWVLGCGCLGVGVWMWVFRCGCFGVGVFPGSSPLPATQTKCESEVTLVCEWSMHELCSVSLVLVRVLELVSHLRIPHHDLAAVAVAAAAAAAAAAAVEP